MKPIYLMLAGLAPLVAAAQAPSPVQVYGLLDAGVVAERGCTGPCARARLDSG
ncbi:porin, partial [Rugamonas sp. FT82W]|nr:porin [Duganella vulcania]